MVDLDTSVNTVLETIFVCNIAGSVRGTNPITNHSFFDTAVNLDLPNVTSNQLTTAFSRSFTVENVGIIDVLTTKIFILTRVKGNGTIRWQISGDGGTNWKTFIQTSFNVGAFANVTRSGSGLWINSITAGINQLQIRLQGLANVGTVNLQLSDQSFMLAEYRQKTEV